MIEYLARRDDGAWALCWALGKPVRITGKRRAAGTGILKSSRSPAWWLTNPLPMHFAAGVLEVFQFADGRSRMSFDITKGYVTMVVDTEEAGTHTRDILGLADQLILDRMVKRFSDIDLTALQPERVYVRKVP